MKMLQKSLAFLAALSLICVLCITAAEGAIYWDFGYYEKEYEKYEVLDELYMEMDDAMYVTREMMAYLRGNRETLSVETYVEGRQQDFFNEQDRFHMKEVRDIFCGALRIRQVAFGIFLCSMALLIVKKVNWKRLVSKWYMGLVGFLTVLSAALAYFITKNFSQCFVIFHEIFFDNDLWMFNPEEDYMIRMLPEGLFADFTVRIAAFAGIFLGVVFLISWILYRNAKRKEEDRALFDIS